MKNLKKLSVAIMLAALFITSFTSCIDGDVDPAVLAIYGAQAELIAAQAAVQNAEADLREADAQYHLALAAFELARAQGELADADYTWELVVGLSIANEEAQVVLEENQAQLAIQLAELMHQLNEVGAIVAAEYATEYKNYLQEAKDALKKRNEKQLELAEAEWWAANSLSDGYAQTALEGAVAVAELQVQWLLDEVAMYEAILDDPNSMPAQVTAWEARYDELELEKEALKAQEVVLWAQIDELVDGVDDDRQKFIDEYEEYLADVGNVKTDELAASGWLGDIEGYEKTIAALELALTDYAAALLAAEGDVEDAEDAVGAAQTALGETDGDGVDIDFDTDFGEYFEVDADGDDLDEVIEGTQGGNVKYAAPANLQEEYVNARIDAANAADALFKLEADFEDLVIALNNAATALAAAQDITAETTALSDAQDDTADAEDDLVLALAAYEDAKALFEADPDGFDVTDGPKVLPFGTTVDDLGSLGISGDANATTFREVTGWVKIVGESEWTPSGLGAPLTEAQVLADIDAKLVAIGLDPDIPGGVGVDPEYNMSDRGDFYLWNQDGEQATFDGGGVLSGFAGSTFGATDGQVPFLVNVITNEDVWSIIYLEVEEDDVPISNLFEFNIATHMLGLDDFSDRDFTSDGKPKSGSNTWTAVLAFGDDDAGYDIAWPGNIAVPFGPDTLTAYAVLWNMQLAEAKAQYDFDVAFAGLATALAEYEYQKGLFDTGVAQIDAATIVSGDMDDDAGDAKEAVDNAWDALGDEYDEGTSADTPKWFKTKTGYVVDASAGYDSDFTTPFVDDTLTLNAVLYNAEIALDILVDCNAACLQLAIDEAQHEIDLIQPSLDATLLILAEMEATYEEYMDVNNSGGDLDGDLAAEVIALEYELLQLKLEKDLVIAERNYVDSILDNINNDDNLADIRWELEQFYNQGGGGSLQDSMNDLANAEDDLAEFLAEQAGLAQFIELRQAAVDEWQARYDAAMTLAAHYLALMNDALAS